MRTITEIQAAIRQLPKAKVAKLKQWLDKEFPPEPGTAYEQWILKARGVAVPGVTTESMMRETREA